MRHLNLAYILILLIWPEAGAQDDAPDYAFFVAGHAYGKDSPGYCGLYPPLIAVFDMLNTYPGMAFGVFTGDMVPPGVTAEDWDSVDADLQFLELPVYRVPGNHDIEDRELFEMRYGSSFYHFLYQNDLFIVLDGNQNNWSILGFQLEYMRNTVHAHYQDVNNIFVFVHQMIWWEEDNAYSPVRPNSFSGRSDPVNFWEEVAPIFDRLKNNVIFFSGDFGAGSWSSDFMYDEVDNLKFIGSGMGDGAGDNLVITEINKKGEVSFKMYCLDNEIDNPGACPEDILQFRISNPGDFTDEQPLIYPNPARDYISVAIPAISENSRMEIIDMKGRVLLSQKLRGMGREDFDISFLSSGVYGLRIVGEKAGEIVKFLIL